MNFNNLLEGPVAPIHGLVPVATRVWFAASETVDHRCLFPTGYSVSCNAATSPFIWTTLGVA